MGVAAVVDEVTAASQLVMLWDEGNEDEVIDRILYQRDEPPATRR